MLSAKGAVWWGWWKKEFENINPRQVGKRLAADNPDKLVLLINSGANRTFLAQYSIISDASGIDAERLPTYYRSAVEEVAAFFLLSRIDEIDHDHQLAERIGDRTLLWIAMNQTRCLKSYQFSLTRVPAFFTFLTCTLVPITDFYAKVTNQKLATTR